MTQPRIRQQVSAYLAEHGPVDDPTGGATSALRRALNYEGSSAGFTQLIAAMDRAGELSRTVKGKRTYRIAQGAGASSAGQTTEPLEDLQSSDLDYDEVAAALLVRVVHTINAGVGQPHDDGSWARRRIERLQRRVDDLERELARAKVESRAIGEERDGLRRQLELSEGNLALLTERLDTARPRTSSVAERLGADERTLLRQLRRPSGNRRPVQAS